MDVLDHAEPGSLCCCEYRNRRGERAHILQCCCACDELDQAADRLFRGHLVGKDSIDEVLSEIDDRLRVPGLPVLLGGIGGAWHIGVAGAAPWVVLPALLTVGAMSARGLLLASVALLPSLYYFHRRMLRIRRRSSLLMSWMLASIAYETLVYTLVARHVAADSPIMPRTFGTPLAATLVLFAIIKRTEPTLLRSDVADASAALSRAVRCAVCGTHVPRYDHYCAWVDEPIGAANHRAYLGFVTCMLLTCAIGAWQLLSYEGRRWCTWQRVLYANESSLLLSCGLYGAAVGVAVGALLVHQCLLMLAGRTAYEARRGVRRAHDAPATSWLVHLRDFRLQTASLATPSTLAVLLRSRRPEAQAGGGGGKEGTE
eukprot:jgi/Chrpa1/8841/Chrysochromulina_OHIO_Genome00021181-RA